LSNRKPNSTDGIYALMLLIICSVIATFVWDSTTLWLVLLIFLCALARYCLKNKLVLIAAMIQLPMVMIYITWDMASIYTIALAESLLVILLAVVHCWSSARMQEEITTTRIIRTYLPKTSSPEKGPIMLAKVHNASVLGAPKEIIIVGNNYLEKQSE